MGFCGIGMEFIKDVEKVDVMWVVNVVFEVLWEVDLEGDWVSDFYENVQILGDLLDDQFNQFMVVIIEWILLEEGCEYCYDVENFVLDEVYIKVVVCCMIQMNQVINVDWILYVGDVGVICYICYCGQYILVNYWYDDQQLKLVSVVGCGDQNVVGQFVGNILMLQNVLMDYLFNEIDIWVYMLIVLLDLNNFNMVMIKEIEGIWVLMMYMLEGFGVNCVICYNFCVFNDWDQSLL